MSPPKARPPASASASTLLCLACWNSGTAAAAYEASPSRPAGTVRFHVAPMQGYTNAQTRKLFRLLSPSSVRWTEMEKLDDIFPDVGSIDRLADALEKRLGPPDDCRDSSLVLQLGTNDPARLRACVRRTVERYDHIREINLNCGCPAIDSGGAPTYGARLMKDAARTGELVRAAREGLEGCEGVVGRPLPGISVKCRIGVFESVEDMRRLDDDDYAYLKDYISTIHENGAGHVVLHARPAILSGLSPVKNRIVPTLDYSFVERIALDFEGEMDVTLNGGITRISQLQSLRETSKSGGSVVAGHMAGRWSLRRPLDLAGVEDLLRGDEREPSPPLPRIRNAIERYLDDAVRTAGSTSSRAHAPTMAELCLPLFLVTEQLRDDYDYEDDSDELDASASEERPMLTYDDIESLYDVVQDAVAQLEELSNRGKKKQRKRGGDANFKRLSSSFKSLVGTKVANKWKRNRAEL